VHFFIACVCLCVHLCRPPLPPTGCKLNASLACKVIAHLQPRDAVVVDEGLTSTGSYWQESKVRAGACKCLVLVPCLHHFVTARAKVSDVLLTHHPVRMLCANEGLTSTDSYWQEVKANREASNELVAHVPLNPLSTPN